LIASKPDEAARLDACERAVERLNETVFGAWVGRTYLFPESHGVTAAWQTHFLKQMEAEGFVTSRRRHARALEYTRTTRRLEEAYDRDVLARMVWPGTYGAPGNAGATPPEGEGFDDLESQALADAAVTDSVRMADLDPLVAAMESYRAELVRVRECLERLPAEIAEGISQALADHIIVRAMSAAVNGKQP